MIAADKTPEQVLRKGETIEDRWAREKEERMFENLHRYENGPGAKLVEGKVDGKRWNSIKYGIDEARGKEMLEVDRYHRIVLGRDDKETQLDDAWRMNPDKPRSVVTKEFEKRYEKWRDEQIEMGIKEGYLARNDKGEVIKVHKDKERPGEKLITGRTRGMEGPE